jgi:hypothetical protein
MALPSSGPVVSLDDQLAAITADLKRHLEREMVALAFEVHANLTHDTPIDTGWAAANWIPGFIDSNPQASPGAAAAGLAAIAAYTLERGSIVIANPVPYVRWLNYGTSHKAPAGFVEIAVERAIATRAGEKTLTPRRGTLVQGPTYSPARRDRQEIRESLRPRGPT